MDELIIRVKPKHIERLAFVAIILILFVVILMQRSEISDIRTSLESKSKDSPVQTQTAPVDQTKKLSEPIAKETSPIVVEKNETSIETPAVNNTIIKETPIIEKPVVNETPVVVVNNTPEKTSDSTTIKAISGRRTFTLNDLKITKKSTDFAKIDSFILKFENGKSGVYLTYKIYVYSENDPQYVKDVVARTVALRKIDEGEIFEERQDVSVGFNKITEEKKLLVIFYDSAGSELDKITKTIQPITS